jgi:hypothetical protein
MGPRPLQQIRETVMSRGPCLDTSTDQVAAAGFGSNYSYGASESDHQRCPDSSMKNATNERIIMATPTKMNFFGKKLNAADKYINSPITTSNGPAFPANFDMLFDWPIKLP